jgi:antitoxin component of RelBE/YafQ-DinJ toxin-antitoxin module
MRKDEFIGIRVESWLKDRLRRYCEERGLGLSECLREIILAYLDAQLRKQLKR